MSTSTAAGSSVDPRSLQSFAEFYPFYLSEHSDSTCRRLHFLGSSLGLACLAMLLATGTWWWLPLGLLLGTAGLLAERQRYRGLSRWFYDYNIQVLELAGRYTGLGYVAVSLVVGVVVPAVALLLLLGVPRRWVLPLAGLFVALLLAYFVLGRMLT